MLNICFSSTYIDIQNFPYSRLPKTQLLLLRTFFELGSHMVETRKFFSNAYSFFGNRMKWEQKKNQKNPFYIFPFLLNSRLIDCQSFSAVPSPVSSHEFFSRKMSCFYFYIDHFRIPSTINSTLVPFKRSC